MDKVRFKFISRDFNLYDLENEFVSVENPLNYKNLPDGEYLIRGDKKSHSKKYYVKNNKWYLVENKTKDNGHYFTNAAIYQLFPQKPESFWKVLNAIPYKCLSKYWQRARFGYNFYMELRKIGRDSNKFRLYLTKGDDNNHENSFNKK